MWTYDGKRTFSLGGRRMQSGYIVICKSSNLDVVTDQVRTIVLA